MPAKDFYHDAVREVLLKDRWRILKENYELEYGGDSYILILQMNDRYPRYC